MRLVVLSILLLAGAAEASDRGHGYGAVGLGTSVATNNEGWALRAEYRGDITDNDDDEAEGLAGARVGFDFWGNSGHWGFAMPIGYYVGAQVNTVRTTLGGGVGLWAFERDGGSDTHYGVAPFLSSSLEFVLDKALVSLDARLSRQVMGEMDDYNVYSVMVMIGKQFK